jgi:hypothetical protein
VPLCCITIIDTIILNIRTNDAYTPIVFLLGEGGVDKFEINPETITSVYERSLELHMAPADMCRAENVQVLVAHL